MPERPIFVVGCPRSGTTLLSTMLHAHPRIAIPPETRFLLPAYHDRHQYGDLRDRDNRYELGRRMTRKGAKFRDLGLRRRDVVAKIVAGPPTFGSAAGTVWREFAHSRGKSRWGEKRPTYWREMDVVLRLFPDAQIVHLVRDGRSCIASLKQVEWWGRDMLGTMTTWTLADRLLREIGQQVPAGSYHYLRYEDLLADPSAELGSLCDFLGEAFDPAMLDRAAAAADIVPSRKTWHDRVHGDLDASRIEAWRTGLTDDELGLFERVAASGLEANGYALSGAGSRPGRLAVADYHRVHALRRANIVAGRARDAVARTRDRTPLADLGE